jgi:hypothetical protein
LKTATQVISQFVKDIAGFVGQPEPIVRKRNPVPEWWRDLAGVPEPQRSKFMGVLVRLRKRGMPEGALNEVCRDYARRWPGIERPFAYYSQFGRASTAAKVKHHDAEHMALKREGFA